MASTFSPNKNIELPGHGDAVDFWDQPVNRNWTAIDTAVAGRVTLNATGLSGNVTLTVAQYTPAIINVTGTLSANVTYVFPAGIGGVWVVGNGTTGNFTLSFASAGGGTAVTLQPLGRTQIMSDGATVVVANNTTLPVGPYGAVQLNRNGFFYGGAGLVSDGSSVTATGNISALGFYGSYLSIAGSANMTGGLTAAALHTTGAAQIDTSLTVGTAAAGEADHISRTSYGAVYTYLNSAGTWGVYDPQASRNRFYTDVAGSMTINASLVAQNTYAAVTAQGSNLIAMNVTYFSYNRNASYYAHHADGYNYMFHAGDGWRSQYHTASGTFAWINSGNSTQMSLDGAGNLYARGNFYAVGNISTGNTIQGGWIHSTGNIHADAGVYGSYIRSYGDMYVDNNLTVINTLNVNNGVTSNYLGSTGNLQVNVHATIGGNISCNGAIWAAQDISAGHNMNCYNSLVFPNASGASWQAGGSGIYLAINGWPYGFTTSGYAWNNGGWVHYSDSRGKKDLMPIAGALSVALAITGYAFTDIKSGDRRVGVLAQDVARVMPQAVQMFDHPDAGEQMGVDYGAMAGALLPQVTKELVALITEQTARTAALEAKVALLEQRLVAGGL